MQKKRNKASILQDFPSLRNFPTAAARRVWLEEKLRIDLSTITAPLLEENNDVHCENLIGGIGVPVGVAGPMLLRGQNANGVRFIPLATTEGALVASVSRGCKAVTLSGGVAVYAERIGQTRGPVFNTKTIAEGLRLKKWIESNTSKISLSAVKTSKHLKYLSSKVKIIGSNSFVRFMFDTSDAMGMNMVTIATEAIVQLIERETKIKCLSVAGNFDTDKKASWLNIIDGRGFEVWAECVITQDVLKKALNTTAPDLHSAWIAKCMIGSYASGSMGFNAHFANIVAAIFIASGQDPAHIVEGSCGITTCEVRGEDLYIAVNLPSLLVGIVGGATVLPQQKSMLALLGITHKSKSIELAEIIAGAVLVGELSLLAALATNSLGRAHQQLGRRKKI